MSRGYAFTNPKEIKQNVQLVLYDGCGWLWCFTSSNIFKVFVNGLDSLKQSEIDSTLPTLKIPVATRSGVYGTGVLVDDFLYVTEGAAFNNFLKINVQTHTIESITTPLNVNMNSNIHYEASKLWMISDESGLQEDDYHKMYVLDLQTMKWSNSLIIAKKESMPFRIWSCGTDYVYSSNWTTFSISYFDSITGTYINKFNCNGYPGPATSAGNHTNYVASYGGMISLINGTAVTNMYNSIQPCNDFNSHIAYSNGYIWFQNAGTDEEDPVLGRIKLADLSVIDTLAEDDTQLLSEVKSDTIDANYTLQTNYSLTNGSYKDLFTIPQYNYVNEAGVLVTSKEKMVAVGSAITIFDPDLVKFVFDKPEVKVSGVGCSGKGMITTGETGYIGEFQ